MNDPRRDKAEPPADAPVSGKSSNGPSRSGGPRLHPAEELSLQQHIRILQGRRNAGSSGKKGKIAFASFVVAAILIAGAILGRRFGFGLGGGAGTLGTGILQTDGTSTPTTPPADWVPKRPLVISIDGMQYKVNGHVVDIPTILEMTKRIPAGDGQAVDISPEGTSKVLAEQDLKKALTSAKVSFTGLPE